MKNLFLIALLILAASCRQPVSVERFLRGTGPYEFAVDFSDSTATWNLDLYSRVDALEAPAEMPLELAWTSPSEAVFTETVYLPFSTGTSFFSHEALSPYRSDVVPSERGVWTLVITVPEPPKGLRGMGLVTHICHSERSEESL